MKQRLWLNKRNIRILSAKIKFLCTFIFYFFPKDCNNKLYSVHQYRYIALSLGILYLNLWDLLLSKCLNNIPYINKLITIISKIVFFFFHLNGQHWKLYILLPCKLMYGIIPSFPLLVISFRFVALKWQYIWRLTEHYDEPQ